MEDLDVELVQMQPRCMRGGNRTKLLLFFSHSTYYCTLHPITLYNLRNSAPIILTRLPTFVAFGTC